MDPRDLADRIHLLLSDAAEARSTRQGKTCIARLLQAQAELVGSDLQALHTKVAWRLCKAAHDFGDPALMLDAVTPLLAQGRPFDDNPAGRRAMAAISKKWWDTQGYSDQRIPDLWQAWAESYQRDGDPWMTATGLGQCAWHWACAGDDAQLDGVIERYLALDPRGFGTGPHRHPKAPDTPSSLWWTQLALVRTGLWQSVWAHRPDRALDLLDAMEDAAEAAEIDRADDVWFLDPVCRAALAFDWTDVLQRYQAAWLQALRRLKHPRAPFHVALAEGFSPDTPAGSRARTLARAVSIADEGGFGAEWQIDARLQLARLSATSPVVDADRLIAEARVLITRFGVETFVGHPLLQGAR